MDGTVDQGYEPEHPRQVGMIIRNGLQVRVRHEADATIGEGHNRVVHSGQQKTVKVDEVAGDADRRDLLTPTTQVGVLAGEAVEEEAADRWFGTVPRQRS
jgi:hypothetical protein